MNGKHALAKYHDATIKFFNFRVSRISMSIILYVVTHVLCIEIKDSSQYIDITQKVMRCVFSDVIACLCAIRDENARRNFSKEIHVKAVKMSLENARKQCIIKSLLNLYLFVI